MGYEIVYDRAFIKTSNGIIPMILLGSNNCAEYIVDSLGRTQLVPERRWDYWPAELLNAPREKYIEWLEKTAIDGNTEFFRFGNNWITGKKLRRWLLNGLESAMTLEEYISLNRSIFLHAMVVMENSSQLYNMAECAERIYTSEQLERWLEKANEKVKELETRVALEKTADGSSSVKPSRRVRIDLCFPSRKPLRKIQMVTGAVVAKKGSHFVKSYIKNKELNFTADPQEAAVFPSVEAATQAMGLCWKLKFVRAETAKKERPFVLRVTTDGGRQQYLRKATAKRYFFTDDICNAFAYLSRRDAMNAAIRMSQRAVWRGRHDIAVCNHITGEEETLDTGR